MHEWFPLMAGVAVALVVQQIAAPRLKIITLVALSAFFGVTATFISGELASSWGFVLIDIALVLLGSTVARVLLSLWKYRIWRNLRP